MTTYKQLLADHEEYVAGQRERAIENGATFVIWSRKRQAWWRQSCCGYTPHLEEAGLFREGEARAIEQQSAAGPDALRSVAVHVDDAMRGEP